MICGIELLCENCLKLGPQLSRRFVVGKDRDGDVMIKVKCPTCSETFDVIFVGKALIEYERLEA